MSIGLEALVQTNTDQNAGRVTGFANSMSLVGPVSFYDLAVSKMPLSHRIPSRLGVEEFDNESS